MLTGGQAQAISYILVLLEIFNIRIDYLPPFLVKQSIIIILVLASTKLGIEHKQT